VIVLSIFSICMNSWFVDSRVLQHLTFWKEIFSTFKEFTLNDKIFIGDNNMFNVCEKGIIFFNLPNGIFKCIGNALYVPKLITNLID